MKKELVNLVVEHMRTRRMKESEIKERKLDDLEIKIGSIVKKLEDYGVISESQAVGIIYRIL